MDNPRYERANIVFNSKTVINGGDGSGNFNHDGRPSKVGGSAISSPKPNYEDFINQHKQANLIETYPDDFIGKTEEDIAKHLGINGNKPAEIKTPIETIKIYKSNIPHIIHEKDQNRLKGLNRALRTMQEPNIILSDKKKNYYIKLFDKKGSNKLHLQIVKTTPKGSYYITNYPLKKGGFNKLEGQVIYDLSSKRGKTSKHIITDIQNDFNPDSTEIFNNVNNTKENTDMALVDELKKLITKVENDKGENMEEKKEVDNEKVDKRKLIDEVGGILKGKVDDEIIRTIIGKMEKMSYDKSEAGTADNEKEEDEKKEVKN